MNDVVLNQKTCSLIVVGERSENYDSSTTSHGQKANAYGKLDKQKCDECCLSKKRTPLTTFSSSSLSLAKRQACFHRLRMWKRLRLYHVQMWQKENTFGKLDKNATSACLKNLQEALFRRFHHHRRPSSSLAKREGSFPSFENVGKVTPIPRWNVTKNRTRLSNLKNRNSFSQKSSVSSSTFIIINDVVFSKTTCSFVVVGECRESYDSFAASRGQKANAFRKLDKQECNECCLSKSFNKLCSVFFIMSDSSSSYLAKRQASFPSFENVGKVTPIPRHLWPKDRLLFSRNALRSLVPSSTLERGIIITAKEPSLLQLKSLTKTIKSYMRIVFAFIR